MIALLKSHGIDPCIRWVNNFIFFRSPITCILASNCPPSFNFNLSTILKITENLGILWHPLLKKGHNFQSSFNYVGFKWDIDSKTVTISHEKCLHLVSKLAVLLMAPPPHVNKKFVASSHGSLKYVTLVYQQGCSHLSALSKFPPKFPNDHVLHHFPNACLILPML